MYSPPVVPTDRADGKVSRVTAGATGLSWHAAKSKAAGASERALIRKRLRLHTAGFGNENIVDLLVGMVRRRERLLKNGTDTLGEIDRAYQMAVRQKKNPKVLFGFFCNRLFLRPTEVRYRTPVHTMA